MQHDDAIKAGTASGMSALTSGKSANGCPVAATMFVLADGTNWGDCKEMYSQGYEIGVHSTQHKSVRWRWALGCGTACVVKRQTPHMKMRLADRPLPA